MQSLSLVRPSEPALRYALFEPADLSAGSVLLTPGLGEHVGRYAHVAKTWSRLGLLTCVYDPRGQGESGGRRAYVSSFDEYVSDTIDLLSHLAKDSRWAAHQRPVLFGHSLGGLIATFVALARQEHLSGLVLSSPFFGQALAIPAWKKTLGRLVSNFWPTYSDETGIKSAMVTHDAEVAQRLDADPLRLTRVTARWFTEVEAAQRRLLPQLSKLTLPVFCLAAGDDCIASVDATRKAFERIAGTRTTLEIAAGEFHELHNEIRREEHIARFGQALLEFSRA